MLGIKSSYITKIFSGESSLILTVKGALIYSPYRFELILAMVSSNNSSNKSSSYKYIYSASSAMHYVKYVTHVTLSNSHDNSVSIINTYRQGNWSTKGLCSLLQVPQSWDWFQSHTVKYYDDLPVTVGQAAAQLNMLLISWVISRKIFIFWGPKWLTENSEYLEIKHLESP